MNVIIINSVHCENITKRISAIDRMLGDDNPSIDLRIGELVEKIVTDPEDGIGADALLRYGPELHSLVEDIMNKLAKTDCQEWFKDVYLVPNSGGMVLVIR